MVTVMNVKVYLNGKFKKNIRIIEQYRRPEDAYIAQIK